MDRITVLSTYSVRHSPAPSAERPAPSPAASRRIPARSGRRFAPCVAPSPAPSIPPCTSPLPRLAAARSAASGGDGRDATFPAGCARRRRRIRAGNAAQRTPDKLRGRAAAAERVRRGAFAVRRRRREAEERGGDNPSNAGGFWGVECARRVRAGDYPPGHSRRVQGRFSRGSRGAGSPPSASARPASRSPAAGSGRRMTSPRFVGRGG